MKTILKLLNDNLNGIMFCSDNQVNNYKNNLKQIVYYLADKKFYSKTDQKMNEGQMYLNFSYLPIFLQSYMLAYDIFPKNNIVTNYITSMYFLLEYNMMGKKNNWKFGYGRLALLCGYILNNEKIYNNGVNILNYAFTQINTDGFILSEMTRGGKTLIYNCKSANFICDSLYYLINTSNFKLNDIIIKYIKAFTNLIVSTFMMKTENIDGIYYISENNKYQINTKAKQEAIHNQELNFLRYDFVYNTLTDTNKNYINNNITILYSKNIINSSPLAIGR